MFSPNTRLAVLEEKLNVYEELSKEMLAKLELAVDKISETNQNIAKVLVRHEERLDQTIQSDQAILKLLDEIKEQRKSDLLRFNDDLEEIKISLKEAHKKINDLSKYRWIIAGALAFIGFVLAETNALSKLFNYTINSPAEIHRNN
jgi:chromosome segregation ATPase